MGEPVQNLLVGLFRLVASRVPFGSSVISVEPQASGSWFLPALTGRPSSPIHSSPCGFLCATFAGTLDRFRNGSGVLAK